jgi:hypothetical protein
MHKYVVEVFCRLKIQTLDSFEEVFSEI